MDKLFSTRLDEDLIRQIDRFVKERPISKKKLIELSVRNYLDQIGASNEHEIINWSFGAWKRKEKPQDTWSQARRAFNKGFSRHIKNQ